MFVIVKYGNDESLTCNPYCAVVNLLMSIKHRAGYGNKNISLDLSDETGLIKELETHKNDYATKHLESKGTYILVQKQSLLDSAIADGGRSPACLTPTPRFQYVPLLERCHERFPNFRLHVTEETKTMKKKAIHVAKSASPAGKFKKKNSRLKRK